MNKKTTNLEIKIQVIDDNTEESFEKVCDGLEEARNYLEGFKSREVYHSTGF